MLAGVELTQEGLAGMIVPEMIKNGIVAGYTLNLPRVIRFEPPLIIEEAQLDQIIEVFEAAVGEADSIYDRMYPQTLK